MKSKLIVLSAALMLVLAGCGNKEPSFTPASSSGSSQETVVVDSITLDKTSLTLSIGQSATLTVTVTSDSAVSVVWESSNAHVTVDEGVVSAVSAGTATVTARAGDKSATCEVTVTDKQDKPDGAVDMEYSTADKIKEHLDKWCYFNGPEWWTGASADINEAYSHEGTVVFDYSYNALSDPNAQDWTVQILKKNTSLTNGTTYDLTFDLKSDKAGQIKVNGQMKTIVVGDNHIAVTYVENQIEYANGISFQIVCSLAFGSARFVLSNIAWNAQGGGGGGGGGGDSSTISAPEGVVVNPIDEGKYIIAFAAVAGATGYKAYYVNFDTGVDVDNEPVTNGGQLTKVDSLAEGKYKVFVTALKDEEESARSESFGTLNLGGEVDLVPPVGIVVNPVDGRHIIAFAPVAGATAYQVYYVDASTSADVDNEEVQNGGFLTKEDTLPSGTYHCYVTAKAGGKESARSGEYGVLTVA